MGEITLLVAQTVNTQQLQYLYHMRMVSFRYIIINTLHKGDNEDNNNNKFKCISHNFAELNYIPFFYRVPMTKKWSKPLIDILPFLQNDVCSKN